MESSLSTQLTLDDEFALISSLYPWDSLIPTSVFNDNILLYAAFTKGVLPALN